MKLGIKKKITATNLMFLVIFMGLSFLFLYREINIKMEKIIEKEIEDKMERVSSIATQLTESGVERDKIIEVIKRSSYSKEQKFPDNITTKLTGDGFVFVIDEAGNMLSHPLFEGKNLIESNKDFLKITQKKDGIIKYISPKTKTMKITVFRYNKELNAIVCMTAFKELIINDNVNVIMKKLLFMFTIFILIITIFIYYFTGKNLKQVAIVGENSYLLAEGDLTVRLNEKTGDEIGDMNKNLNSFIHILEEIIGGIKSQSENIVKNSEEVLIDMNRITKNSDIQIEEKYRLKEIMEYTKGEMQGILDNVRNQVAGIEQMASAIVEVSQTITEVAKNAETTIVLSDKTYSSANEGYILVEKTMAGMEKLQIDSMKIDDMLRSLNKISEQTKLLALNVAIQAARAGESGKGFAVVADEVRKLSLTSQEFTSNISEINEKMQKNVESTIEISKETKEKMKEVIEKVSISSREVVNVSKAVEEQVIAMNEIETGTQNLASASSEIESKAMEQTNKLIESQNRIVQISNLIDDNSRAVVLTAKSAKELTGISKQLKTMIEKFKIR